MPRTPKINRLLGRPNSFLEIWASLHQIISSICNSLLGDLDQKFGQYLKKLPCFVDDFAKFDVVSTSEYKVISLVAAQCFVVYWFQNGLVRFHYLLVEAKNDY